MGMSATTKSLPQNATLSTNVKKCRQKFLRFFKDGFRDETYDAWERDYKWTAHQRWDEMLGKKQFGKLIQERNYTEIALRAVHLESRTNLLFSFEKMALRDAVKSTAGAKLFATGLYDFVYGSASLAKRFKRWCNVVAALPRKQTRVLTWPIVTVFGFLARPKEHIFLKSNVTRRAAEAYGFDFHYTSKPSWETYGNFLQFARTVKSDLGDLRPRDMIDIQSFLWVQGSDEYA